MAATPHGTRTLHGVALATAIGAGLLLSGCSGAAGTPDDPIAAARQLPDANADVRNGNAADSCGQFALDQGELLPDSALDCMADAAGTTTAELAFSRPTTEGDPIVSFAFVGPDFDGVKVFATTEYDSFGGDGPNWTGISCPDARDVTGTGNCEQLVEG